MADEGREPVSIVCVFNNAAVRSSCLDRSIRVNLDSAPDTEYIPVDNTRRQYATAGAALNAGAAQARHRVVVFVHQDVYLHSLVALEQAAARLVATPDIGFVGAIGVTSSGEVAGVVRDRVVFIGHPSTDTDAIDSVDEVLVMVTRDRVLSQPLSEDPDLAWHAYAVEYGARVRSQGLRVVTADLPLTHNSMTTNLDRLDEAHRHIARLYPSLTPMRTTCGVVRTRGDTGAVRTAVRRHRGAATWWHESVAAARLARAAAEPLRDVALADVRLVLDDALDCSAATGLDVVNLGPSAGDWDVDVLTRRGRPMAATSRSADGFDALPGHGEGRALLVTGVDDAVLARLAPSLRDTPHILGLWRDTGTWLLCHPDIASARTLWTAHRNAPYGRRPARRPAAATAAGEPVNSGG